jgi:hypothetical protein
MICHSELVSESHVADEEKLKHPEVSGQLDNLLKFKRKHRWLKFKK